jgi:hypothetical protein
MRFEACLELDDAKAAISCAFEGLKPHCVYSSHQGRDYAFELQSAKALVHAEPHILWIRVEAEEIAICHGTKMLIVSEIGNCAKNMPNVLWVEANDDPFAAIMAHNNSEMQPHDGAGR